MYRLVVKYHIIEWYLILISFNIHIFVLVYSCNYKCSAHISPVNSMWTRCSLTIVTVFLSFHANRMCSAKVTYKTNLHA